MFPELTARYPLAQKCRPQNLLRRCGNSCSSTRELIPLSQIIWLKGISSRVLYKNFTPTQEILGPAFLGKEHLAVSSGNITDEMVKEHIENRKVNRSLTIVDFQSTAVKSLGL